MIDQGLPYCRAGTRVSMTPQEHPRLSSRDSPRLALARFSCHSRIHKISWLFSGHMSMISHHSPSRWPDSRSPGRKGHFCSRDHGQRRCSVRRTSKCMSLKVQRVAGYHSIGRPVTYDQMSKLRRDSHRAEQRYAEEMVLGWDYPTLVSSCSNILAKLNRMLECLTSPHPRRWLLHETRSRQE